MVGEIYGSKNRTLIPRIAKFNRPLDKRFLFHALCTQISLHDFNALAIRYRHETVMAHVKTALVGETNIYLVIGIKYFKKLIIVVAAYSMIYDFQSISESAPSGRSISFVNFFLDSGLRFDSEQEKDLIDLIFLSFIP